MKLDPLDAAILRLLLADARRSFREIAAEVGASTPTVSERVRALEDLGVLRGYRAEVDPAVLGGALVLVTVRTRPAAAQRVAEALGRFPGAEEVLVLAGGAVHARVRLRAPEGSLAALHAALAALEDVQGYEVAEVLAAPHRAAPEPDPERLDVRCHQCQGPIHAEPVKGRLGGRPHVFCCRQCLADFKARFERAESAAKR